MNAQPDSNQRLYATLIHLLSALVAPFITPLVAYLVFKPTGGFAFEQAREGLNFQITVILATIAVALPLVTIWLIPIVAAAAWINLIWATVRVFQGQAYRFPVCLRLI